MEDLIGRYLRKLRGKDLKTPHYIYFPEQLKKNIQIFKRLETEGNLSIFYAVKSNNYKPLVKDLIVNNIGFDVASREELNYVLNLGADVNKITFSAPTKREECLKYANKVGVKYYAFDSEAEIKKITRLVENPILVARLTAYNKDAVFNLSSKFGMSDEYFLYILRKAKKNNWPIKGLTFHVGSQNSSSDSWRREIRKIESHIETACKMGLKIEYVNLGGGIPAPYDSTIADLDYYVERILGFCKSFTKRFPDIKIFIEPGRAMCANTTALVTKVIDIKTYKKPAIAVVDTGVFNGIIEPLEHFEYPLYLDHYKDCEMKYYKIVGFSCEGYDIIKQKVLLPKRLEMGDLVIIMYAGAYTFVYHDFHMVPYPEIKNFASM